MPADTTTAQRRLRAAHNEVLSYLDQFLVTLAPGDRVPTHTELMRRFSASERTILRALDEMQRNGRIVRRHGSGTFVSDAASSSPSTAKVADTVVALTVPDRSFFDRCMDRLFRHVEAADLSLSCRPVNALSNPEDVVASLQSQDHDTIIGYIVFHNILTPVAQCLQAQGQRVVLIGAPNPDSSSGVPCVYSDHEQGGYMTARYLLDLGHRHLLLFQSREETLRWRGYRRAISEARRNGASVRISYLQLGEQDSWLREPEKAIAFFRRSEKGPIGILAWNDYEAAKLSVVLGRIGIKIPDDVSLIGYDALPEGELVYPPLTTVDQAMDRQLRAALDLLTQTKPPEPNHTVVVLPTLVVRGSCAAVIVPDVVQSASESLSFTES